MCNRECVPLLTDQSTNLHTLQKGSFFPIPTRLTRVTAISQVHLSRRDPRLHNLLRGTRPHSYQKEKRIPYAHDISRFLRVATRVPGQTAESACTTHATRLIVVPTVNVPPAARTGGEAGTTGSFRLARQLRLKTIGRAGREETRRRKVRRTIKAMMKLRKRPRPRLRRRCLTALRLGLLKHLYIATNSALQVLGGSHTDCTVITGVGKVFRSS